MALKQHDRHVQLWRAVSRLVRLEYYIEKERGACLRAARHGYSSEFDGPIEPVERKPVARKPRNHYTAAAIADWRARHVDRVLRPDLIALIETYGITEARNIHARLFEAYKGQRLHNLAGKVPEK